MKNLPLFSGFALLLAACGAEPSPVVVGSVGGPLMAGSDVSAHSDISVEINGDDRIVQLEDQSAFTLQELPTGELEFRIEIEGITGTIEVHDVLPGEVIEVGADAGLGSLEMRVIRRDAPSVDPAPVEVRGGIEISGRKVVHHLDNGRHQGDLVITGDHVTVVGPDYYGCRSGGRAIIEGDLIVEGRHARVINVEVEGRTVISGDHARVFEPCAHRYGDDDSDSDSDSDKRWR